MIEYLNGCSRIINSFATNFNKQYKLEYEELVSEGWVCAVEAYNNWNPDNGSKYTTYLFTRLNWLRKTIINKYIRRKIAEKAYYSNMSLVYEDQHVFEIYTELKSKLNKKELKIFNLYTKPSSDFLNFIRDKRNTKIITSYYAEFLGVSNMKVVRTLQKSKDIIS